MSNKKNRKWSFSSLPRDDDGDDFETEDDKKGKAERQRMRDKEEQKRKEKEEKKNAKLKSNLTGSSSSFPKNVQTSSKTPVKASNFIQSVMDSSSSKSSKPTSRLPLSIRDFPKLDDSSSSSSVKRPASSGPSPEEKRLDDKDSPEALAAAASSSKSKDAKATSSKALSSSGKGNKGGKGGSTGKVAKSGVKNVPIGATPKKAGGPMQKSLLDFFQKKVNNRDILPSTSRASSQTQGKVDSNHLPAAFMKVIVKLSPQKKIKSPQTKEEEKDVEDEESSDLDNSKSTSGLGTPTGIKPRKPVGITTKGAIYVDKTSLLGAGRFAAFSTEQIGEAAKVQVDRVVAAAAADESPRYGTVATVFPTVGYTSIKPLQISNPGASSSSSSKLTSLLDPKKYNNEEINNKFGTFEKKKIKDMTKKQLRNFMERVSPVGSSKIKYKCHFCDKTDKITNLESHLRTVGKSKFASKNTLPGHGDQLADVFVDLSTSFEEIEETFEPIEGNSEQVLCLICGIPVSSNRTMYQHHFRGQHGNNFDRPLVCDSCPKRFDTRYFLNNHAKDAHGEPYHCEEEGCHKSFKTRRGLQLHMRLHTGDSRFQCGDCGKQFLNAGGLALHREMHDPQNLPCPICLRKFDGPCRLRRHIQNIHLSEVSEDVQCPIDGCNDTVKKGSLEYHLLNHEKYATATCSICNVSFTHLQEEERENAYKEHIMTASHFENLTSQIHTSESKYISKLPEGEYYEEIQLIPSRPSADFKECECGDVENCKFTGEFYHRRFICDCEDPDHCLNHQNNFDIKEIKYKNISIKINTVTKCSTRGGGYLWEFEEILRKVEIEDGKKPRKYYYAGQYYRLDGFIERTKGHFRGDDGHYAKSFFFQTDQKYRKRMMAIFSVPDTEFDPWAVHLMEILVIKILELQNKVHGVNTHGGGPLHYLKNLIDFIGEGVNQNQV